MKHKEINFDPATATRRGAVVAIVALVVGLVPYWFIWGENPFRLALQATGMLGLIIILNCRGCRLSIGSRF